MNRVKGDSSSGASSAMGRRLLRTALCLDAVCAISGVPVMVAQGAYVQFRTALMLLVFQLCYIVPQLFSTATFEKVATRLRPSVALSLTIAASAAASVVGWYALMSHSVTLFFTARFLNGVCRHEKLLSRLVAVELGAPASEPGQWALYGTLIGMIVAGGLYDNTKDAAQVAGMFVVLHVCAAALTAVLAVLMRRTAAKKPAPADTVAAYHDWFTRALRSRTEAPLRHAAGLLFAGALLASAHQSLYVIVDPSILRSYTLTGAHLAGSLALSVWGVPWLLRRLHWDPSETRLATAAFSLLLAGGLALPVTVSAHSASQLTWAAYVISAFIFDVGAGLLTTYLSSGLRHAVDADHAAHATRLTVHITMVAKLLGAVVRLLVAERMPRVRYPLYVVGTTLGLFLVFQVYTKSQRLALAAFVVAFAVAVSVS